MSYFGKFRGRLLHPMILIGLVIVSVIPARSWAFAQSGSTPIWVVRSLHTSQYGVNDPKGLAFSSKANTFFVLDGSSNVTLVTMGEARAGIRVIPDAQADPLNAAFDKKSGSLFMFNPGRSELVQIQSDGKGSPARFGAGALGIQDSQGIAFGSGDGRLFILDAGTSQIISVAPHPTLGFDANEAIRSNKVERISLKKLGTGIFRGLAFNPGNGHLYVSEPAQKRLYELTQSGSLVTTFDLAALGISDPSAMTFAPSVDNTDAPEIQDLFILDSGLAAKSDSQIVELSLQPAAALPAGTTLLPASLVHTIDTSKAAWSPSAPDPGGVDYWPLTGRLLISDSEVEEMSNYWQGKNVFDATTAGTLVSTCTTFTSPPTTLTYNNFSGEPTGVAINPNNNHIFFSTDYLDRVFEVSLGADGKYCTPDDTVTSTDVAGLYKVTDAEDVAYGNNTLFIGGGDAAEVYRIPLGANGVLGGGDDGPMTHFDTAALGFADMEALGYNADAGTLLLASAKATDRYLGETTTTGTLLRAYDLSLMGTAGNIRSDVTYAPGSQNPAIKNIYIVSRGVDNDNDPKENDGKVWEISISGPGAPTPSRTPTNTSTPTPTFTPGPSPTPTLTLTPTATSIVPDLIFADGFESGDLLAWSSSSTDLGNLSVSSAAALIGSQGLQALINDNNAIYVTDNSPNGEPRYRARFYFDPNSISMVSGDAHNIFFGYAGTSTAVLRGAFRFSSGVYQIRFSLLSDSGTWQNTSWFTISDAAHAIELDWRAATAVGANNGGLTLWIDGTQQADLTGVDNDTRRVDSAKLGALSGIDTGTRGTYYFDAFESRRQSFIGP